MQNVSRVVGGPVHLKVKGQDILLKEMTLENLGAIQEEMLRLKRRRHLETAAMAREFVPPDEWQVMFREARREAAEMLNSTEAEATQFFNTQEGVSFFFWVIFESQYPGLVKKSEIADLLRDETISSGDIESLTSRLFGNNGGNEIGQSNEVVPAP